MNQQQSWGSAGATPYRDNNGFKQNKNKKSLDNTMQIPWIGP